MIARPGNYQNTSQRTSDQPFALRQNRFGNDYVAQRFSDLGTVVTPAMGSLQRIINQLGTRGGDTGRICLSEGTWDFYDTLVLNTPCVELIGTPGRTVFRKLINNGKPIIQVGGATGGERCAVEGVSFYDPNETAAYVVQVSANGTKSRIRNCRFNGVYGAIKLNAVSGVLVAENLIQTATAPYAIWLAGATTTAIVQCNRAYVHVTDTIYADDAATYNAFSGNNTGATGTISYKGALGSAAAGNVATVTVR